MLQEAANLGHVHAIAHQQLHLVGAQVLRRLPRQLQAVHGEQLFWRGHPCSSTTAAWTVRRNVHQTRMPCQRRDVGATRFSAKLEVLTYVDEHASGSF